MMIVVYFLGGGVLRRSWKQYEDTMYPEDHENKMFKLCTRKIMKTRCLKMHNILDTFNMILLAGVE